MEMELEEIRKEGLSHLEEKFQLIKTGENTYEGKYPLEPFMKGGRGTYGGEFLSQTMLAAWLSLEDGESFSPNSLHSQFIKAGSQESVMRYEVLVTNHGRNFAHCTVQCYQKSTNQICFSMVIMFTKKNSVKEKHKIYKQDKSGKIAPPFGFQAAPQSLFNKYKDHLDKMPFWEHTNGNLRHIIPKEYVELKNHERFLSLEPGDRKLGVFFRVNDDLSVAKDFMKTNFASLAFATDSFWLSSVIRALGLPLNPKYLNYFRVSLDHSVWFHDIDFDSSQWMFMDWRFLRLENDRVLAVGQVYTLDGVCIASFSQEGLMFLNKDVVNRVPKLAKL